MDPNNIQSLPNELLIQIATFLASEPPSIVKFSHEPCAQLTSSDHSPLKSLSLVSWRWRKIVLPLLFSYTRIRLDPNPQWIPIDARLLENMQANLTSLTDHELQIYQKMRSKFKTSSVFAYEEAFDDLLINLCRVKDGDEFLQSVPNMVWLPHLPKGYADFAKFVMQYELKHHVKSIVVFSEKEYELRHVSTADALLGRAVAEIWSSLFFRLEPARVVVAAPPATLAGLLDTQMVSSDAWAFDMKMHYVELRQPEPLRTDHMRSSACRPWDSALIHRRPWCRLGYNEGSSITAYSTYEYHLKQSPKMLYLILLRFAKEAADCCNITSFSFTGVFPFATNVATIIRALHGVRTLQTVQFQLAPGPENSLLRTPKRMGRAQPHDLWLEWNESYKVITTFLGVHDFATGGEFISEDCGEAIVAAEVDEYVGKLQERGAGWRKEREGKWVRDCSLDTEEPVAVNE